MCQPNPSWSRPHSLLLMQRTVCNPLRPQPEPTPIHHGCTIHHTTTISSLSPLVPHPSLWTLHTLAPTCTHWHQSLLLIIA